ncbi:MAG: caspase family protein [Polaromonas sp.]|nr:caspase family protein [Polaromonas sp.]
MNVPLKTAEYVTLALLLICADLQSGFAQTPARSTVQGDRNLLVQATSAIATPGAKQTQRVALVIGNAAYKEAPLVNPVNDARAIAQALQESGFNVILRENTDQRGMLAALREFGDRLRAGGTGLFYYAGHGMQIKGRNYLIPIGANVEREDEIAYSTVDAQAVLDKMEAAGNPANIMILDACRNNPFVRSSRSGQSGLSQMDAPAGTLVAFSTAPGAVASDGTGANGLYTQHLLNAVRQSGSKVEDVFKQVRANVRRESQGKQIPWEVTSLEGDFYFRGMPSTGTDTTVETALWEAVKTSDIPLEIRAYLGRYPNGRYAESARLRLAQLPSAPVTTATPATLPSLPALPAQQPAVSSAAIRYTVGDNWTYSNEDQLTGKQSSFSRKVSSIANNGDALLNDGALVTSAAGQTRYFRNAERERFYTESYRQIPSLLRAGFKEPVSYSIRSKYKDGSEKIFTGNGTLEVLGREKITTPAGQFMAWRIKRVVRGANETGSEIISEQTFWYAPEINNLVAQENTDTSSKSGNPVLKTRVILQSFNLTDASAMNSARSNMAQAASQAGGVEFATAAPVSTGDQAAIDRRTEELLASIAAQPVSTITAARPTGTSNKLGFTTGDRWRYQTVDKYKGEVVANFSYRVDKILPNGDMSWNKGNIVTSPEGNFRRDVNNTFDRRDYSQQSEWIPAELRVGYKQDVRFTVTARRGADNFEYTEEYKGVLAVKGKEKIRVPAGEFEAYKVERITDFSGVQTNGNARWYGRNTMAGWYVPELRNFVAREHEHRVGNSPPSRDRIELTSFSVRGAENLAQR